MSFLLRIKYGPLVLLALLLSLASTAQWKITRNDIALVAAQLVAGSADGVNQNIQHLRYGPDKPYWDGRSSWKLKYKDFDNGDLRAAYPGAKTWLVGFTDGFHLTRTIDRAATLASIGIVAADWQQVAKKDRWKYITKKLVLSAIANRIAFNIIYKEKQ